MGTSFSRPVTIALLALLSFAFPALAVPPTGSCSNCGSWPWNDSCGWASATVIQTGNSYYVKAECEKKCNPALPSPNACNKISCTATASAGQENTYKLSGGLTFEVFNLSAGWDTQKSQSAGCEFKEECSQPSCCVGPGFAYIKYTYSERARWKYDYSSSYFCTTCNANTQTGVLETYANPVCSGTQHSQYEPALMGSSGYCTSVGVP